MKNRSNQIVKVSVIGIITNLILVGFKAFVGFVSGAISIIMDAINNLSDAGSSIVTIIGTKLANKKPTKKHPYGYGRIEYLTSLVIASIILVTGFTSIVESIKKIIEPTKANYDVVSIVIVSVAIIVKIVLGLFTKKKGKELNSDSLVGSGNDAMFDAIISSSTLVGIIVSLAFNVSIEGILGILISVFIVKAGVEILISSVSGLIGTRVDSETTIKIKQTVNEFEGVNGAYDLILNKYGPEKIIGAIHIEVNDDMTAKEIHALTHAIQTKIYQEFGIFLTVGIYASIDDESEYSKIKQDLFNVVKQYENVIQTHGFYVDSNTDIVTFDIVVSFKEKNPELIKQEIESKMKELYPDYQFFANIDADYSD